MKQAVILAAGEGARLRPFTVNRPKTMLPIADKPILGYVVEALAAAGIRDVVVVVGYRKQHIYDYLGSGEQFGVAVSYVVQETQLGTAHALGQAKDALGDRFLVIPGDNLISADTISGFLEVEPPAVLVQAVANPSRYGVVNLTGKKVAGITEKPEEASSNIVSTGIYSLGRDFFETAGLDIPEVINLMIEQGAIVSYRETEGLWRDVVYPWDILNLSDAVLRDSPTQQAGTVESGVTLKGSVSVGKGSLIRSGSYIEGPAVIGQGCEIGPSVVLLPACSIGDNVSINAFTQLKNSVIGSDVTIGPGSIVEDSVIDQGSTIGAHFTCSRGEAEIKVEGEYHTVTTGAMIGEGCAIGSGVVVQPGTIMGNRVRIAPQKNLSGYLPDKGLVL